MAMDTAPPAVLAMQARFGSPIAVLQQCVDRGKFLIAPAFRAVLDAAVAVSQNPVELLEAAADLAHTIAHESPRHQALLSVVEHMLSIDPDDQSSVDTTHRFVLAMEPAAQRGALSAVAKSMAARSPDDPMAIDRAVAVLDRLHGESGHARTLAQLGAAIFGTDRATAETLFCAAMDAAGDEPSPGSAARWVVQIVLERDTALGASLFAGAFSDPTLTGGDETRRALVACQLLDGQVDPDGYDGHLLLHLDDETSSELISFAIALAESNESSADQAAQLARLGARWHSRDSVTSDTLFEQAIELGMSVEDEEDRQDCLLEVIEAMSCASDLSLNLLNRAEVLVGRMDSESWQRDASLRSIAVGLVRLDPTDRSMVERALRPCATSPRCCTSMMKPSGTSHC